jgi:hypothetical protein
MSKGADEAIGGETLCYLRVFIHVRVIVQIDEIVPQSLTKNQPSDCDQSEADKERLESRRGDFF